MVIKKRQRPDSTELCGVHSRGQRSQLSQKIRQREDCLDFEGGWSNEEMRVASGGGVRDV